MPSSKPTLGVNDLQSQFPDIAAEAYGWDPETVAKSSHQKKDWRCKFGHLYSSIVYNRTNRGDGCPVCGGDKVLAGFNDLKTKFPDIAAEAYGWDPSTITKSSGQKKDWKCKEGHIYNSAIYSRTGDECGCPVCAGRQVLAGFNDLKTKFPDIAAEAYGWDPSTIIKSSGQKKDWKCDKGHIYSSTVNSRTSKGTGCAICEGQRTLPGFNDLQTMFSDIAAEAFEWEPSTVVSGTNKKKDWKCKEGHTYLSSVSGRIRGRGCPICSGWQVLAGFNDLKAKFPDIAAEAYGWDPVTVSAGTHQKKDWKCKEGHIYSSVVNSRTSKGTGCAICAGKKVLAGFNDLQTKFPDIAAEAFGWDPLTVTSKALKRRMWKCNLGHIYEALVSNRTNGKGCPFCVGRKVLSGFNDLQTMFPDIAAEAFEWDPSTVTAGTNKKKDWKCKEGHIYSSAVVSRTNGGNGCAICAEYGFNPEKDAWFYLMQRPGEQQLGITNDFFTRMKKHESNGWTLLEHTTVPSKGQKVLDTENALKKWLKKEIGLMEGTTENWSTTKMEVQSLAELKSRSGIETDLF